MSKFFNQHFINSDNICFHKDDLPVNFNMNSKLVAIDTEAMGLKHTRDRLCLVQLCCGDGFVHLVQISKNPSVKPVNLIKILADESIKKIFHFARFDVAILYKYLDVLCKNIYCTKIASYLSRTYTDRHGLKEVCREMLGVEISKAVSSSYWGAHELSQEQKEYAASDVLHLHALKAAFDKILIREGRADIAEKCFEFLPYRSQLDVLGWDDIDIFSHCIKRD